MSWGGERKSPRGNRVLVVSSLVSSIYVRVRSSVFNSMCWRRSRTLTVFGELLSRVLKIGRLAVQRCLTIPRIGDGGPRLAKSRYRRVRT